MQPLRIGDVTITSIVERNGPWRRPSRDVPGLCPGNRPQTPGEAGPRGVRSRLRQDDITYQTFVVRTPNHTILVDTCTGEDKGYPAPMDFPKQPWLDGLPPKGCVSRTSTMSSAPTSTSTIAAGTPGWQRAMGANVPNAKYVFHKGEYAAWEEATARGDNPPGNVWRYNCEPVVEAGQALLVTTISPSTTPSAAADPPAIRPAIAASTSPPAGSAPSSPAT